jgi:rhodanese-related sulfurtransferase
VVLVCYSGDRSLKATYYLQYRGYTQVSNMAGGIAKWAKKGFPIKGKLEDVVSDISPSTSCCG